MMFLDYPAWIDAEDGRAPAPRHCRDRYILIGIAFEERDLIQSLGKTYADYRARVPALIPGCG